MPATFAAAPTLRQQAATAVEKRRRDVQRATSVKQRKLAGHGGERNADGRPAWCFFAPQSSSNKITLTDATIGKSRHALNVAKAEHMQPVASAKDVSAVFWGTDRAEAAARQAYGPTPVPMSVPVSPARNDPSAQSNLTNMNISHPVRVPNMDLLSAGARREWNAAQRRQERYIKLNETGLQRRRVSDKSRQTLDNAYRQQQEPVRTASGARVTVPVMTAIMTGMEADTRNARMSRQDFLAMNKQHVRSASATVRSCRGTGLI